MSWQTYVDTNLVGSGKVTKAAIVGLQGGVWAASEGFKLEATEEKALLNAHQDTEKTQSSGLRIAGNKYFTLSVDSRSVYCKKGADGVLVVKTKQALLVAVYEAPLQQAETAPVVEGLADYLINAGY